MSLLFIPRLPTCFPQLTEGGGVGCLSRFVEVAQDSSCSAWGAGLRAHQLLKLGECLQLVRAAMVLLGDEVGEDREDLYGVGAVGEELGDGRAVQNEVDQREVRHTEESLEDEASDAPTAHTIADDHRDAP